MKNSNPIRFSSSFPSSPHPNVSRMSRNWSNLLQLLATYVLSKERHFIMKRAHREAGCSIVLVTAPFSSVVVIVSVLSRMSASAIFNLCTMNLMSEETCTLAI
jgi:hypothetical protein